MVSGEFTALRERMVADDLRARGITDERVLAAMGTVPREEFVGRSDRERAYLDQPLPIGDDQTISQPYVVALMLEALELSPGDRLLEIGAGSGYAVAVAATICEEVVGIERIGRLAAEAEARLVRLGFTNASILEGDGSIGWLPGAPYDAILVSAGAPDVPPALIDQIVEGGRIVIPVAGPGYDQRLVRVRRTAQGVTSDDLGGVAFVPLIGEQGWSR